MTHDNGIIAEGERGHRRGTVLGFTMAELMLLLLFCLLLASAGILAQQKEQIDELGRKPLAGTTAKHVEELTTSDKALKELMVLLFPGGIPKLTPSQISELWNELVLARETTRTLTEGEPRKEELDRLAEGLAELAKATSLDKEQVAVLLDRLEKLHELGIDQLSRQQIDELMVKQAGAMPGHQWPPIISIADDGNRFELGSAGIKQAFRDSIERDVVPTLLKNLADYDADVIEIIGHTDEQPITPTKPSNLDTEAINAVWGRVPSDSLVAVDNTGLGMARAVAVASVLKASGQFDGYKIMALSAGQLLLPGDVLSDGTKVENDRGRRRIDIRVRRSDAAKVDALAPASIGAPTQ